MQAAVWSQPHSSHSYCLSGIGTIIPPPSRRKSSGYQPPSGTLSDISLSPSQISPLTDHHRHAHHSREADSFTPINGRPVLALGLALILSGSILGLFGIAGLFSHGDERLSIGLGAVSALLAILAGITGSRAGKNFFKNRRMAMMCAVFSVLCFISDVICIGFCARIIARRHIQLLKAIAGAEVFFAAIGLILSFCCSIVTIKLLCEIPKLAERKDKTKDENGPKIYEIY